MKNWVFIAILSLGAILVGCDKKDDNSGQQVVVQPPPAPTTQCINGQANCNPNVYQQYSPYGFAPYGINPYTYGGYYPYWNNYGMNVYGNGYNNNSYVGFCNCPSGYRPVYNSGMGLGCVALNYFQPVAYGAFYWGLQPQNYQWVNFNQVSNTNGYPAQNTCFDNVAGSCVLNNPSYGCPAGLTCYPTAGGSQMGICRQ